MRFSSPHHPLPTPPPIEDQGRGGVEWVGRLHPNEVLGGGGIFGSHHQLPPALCARQRIVMHPDRYIHSPRPISLIVTEHPSLIIRPSAALAFSCPHIYIYTCPPVQKLYVYLYHHIFLRSPVIIILCRRGSTGTSFRGAPRGGQEAQPPIDLSPIPQG